MRKNFVNRILVKQCSSQNAGFRDSPQLKLLVVLEFGINVTDKFDDIRDNGVQAGIVIDHENVLGVARDTGQFGLGSLADPNGDVTRRLISPQPTYYCVKRRR